MYITFLIGSHPKTGKIGCFSNRLRLFFSDDVWNLIKTCEFQTHFTDDLCDLLRSFPIRGTWIEIMRENIMLLKMDAPFPARGTWIEICRHGNVT